MHYYTHYSLICNAQVTIESQHSATEYSSTLIERNTLISPSMAFDPKQEHIYIMTDRKVTSSYHCKFLQFFFCFITRVYKFWFVLKSCFYYEETCEQVDPRDTLRWCAGSYRWSADDAMKSYGEWMWLIEVWLWKTLREVAAGTVWCFWYCLHVQHFDGVHMSHNDRYDWTEALIGIYTLYAVRTWPMVCWCIMVIRQQAGVCQRWLLSCSPDNLCIWDYYLLH